jgi:hypothetical protein
MIVESGTEYNFIYLLPPKENSPQRVMVPSQLQMGWKESAAFFCTASQSFTNLSDIIIDEPITMQHLGPHAMESYYFPPIWGDQPSPSKKQK